MSRRRRKKQTEFQHVGEILQKALKKRKLHLRVEDHHLSDAWQKAVGSIISTHTRVHNLRGDTLFVKVSTSTWMQQLQFMKQEIIDKVNAVLENETIQNIYFSIGTIDPFATKQPQETKHDSGKILLRDRDRKVIEESTASISDDELKDILKRVMKKEIINRRNQQEE